MAQYNVLTEKELTLLLGTGDHGAFQELYHRYWETLLNTAFKTLDSIEEAEEIVQDLFITLYVNRDSLQINTTLEGYLKTALKRKVLNFYRSKHVHEKYLKSILSENRLEFYTPYHALQAKELSQRVEVSTQKMPEKCREVFILSRIENLPNKTIAEKLSISISTVEKHISKAIRILKADFREYNFSIALFLFYFLSN